MSSSSAFPTKPAFIHRGTWDDETRAHPAMKWMEEFTLNFNRRGGWEEARTDWHSDDFSLVKSDGTEVRGHEPAWEQVKAMYGFFTSELHEPYLLVCWETDDGWEMLGQANFYANCVGGDEKSSGERQQQQKKVKDLQGREWDVKIPSAFRFVYVKTDAAAHGGIELKRCEIMSDSMPAVQILMQRGVNINQ
ncbi:hypothetical protein PV08_10510 [Exophiala spinifera]|uniref:SnoaL-like domain-containing protein n=1 Tax=Exophiala spinifera TaxID=91928 RepID=A0A0D2AXM3_9EURO|nr:uncharacterized protein PV08_10510 [Exophiala spinifera]KIW11210.1 hypothetical protein PV08_10510 [Exophiala spinifera]